MAAAGRGRTAACSRVVPLLLLAALFCLLAPQQTAAARSVSIDVDPSTLDLGQDFLHELYYRATGRRLQQTCPASYAPAVNQNCAGADGGTACSAKELTITSASISNPIYISGPNIGSSLATGPCCANPGQTCAQCEAGTNIVGSLTIVMAVNSKQGRYDLGLWSVQNDSPSPDQQNANSVCQKNALNPTAYPNAQEVPADCCGDVPNGAQVPATIPNFNIKCTAPTPPAGGAFCPGAGALNWCLGWSPNVNGAPCVVVPPSSGGFANGGSYVPQKVGTPAKCSCGSSSLNIDTFVPTCGDTSISSGLQPFTGCTAGRELNPSRGTLAPATDAVCCMAIGTPVVDFTLKKESWNAAMTAPLPGNQVAPSTPFTFKFTITNIGNTPSSGPITVTDDLPLIDNTLKITFTAGSESPNTVVCSQGSGQTAQVLTCVVSNPDAVILPNGGTFSFFVTATAGGDGAYLNKAAVDPAAEQNGNPFNNNAEAPVLLVAPQGGVAVPEISKTAPTSVIVGQTFNYTIRVLNSGGLTTGNLQVEDTIPACATPTGTATVSTPNPGVTCTAQALPTPFQCTSTSGLASGASFTITVPVTAATTGTCSNTASLSENQGGSFVQVNTDSADTTVNPQPADLFVNKTAPASAATGSNITYTIYVENKGPGPAIGFTLSDPLPVGTTFSGTSPATITAIAGSNIAGLSCPVAASVVTCTGAQPLAAGTKFTVSFPALVTAFSGNVVNRVAVNATGTIDPNPADNTASVSTAAGPIADVKITKAGPSTPPAVGDTFSYVLNISNAGPSSATAVQVTDNLPSGVASAGTPTVSGPNSAGTSCSVTGSTVTCFSGPVLPIGGSFIVTIPVTAAAGGTYSNTASVNGSFVDPNPADNNATISTPVAGPLADLSITKSAPASIKEGVPFNYVLTINNAGPDAATSVNVRDALPGSVSAIGSATVTPAAAATCGISGQVLTCSAATLSNGGSFTVTIPVVGQSGTVLNTATVNSSVPDPTPANNAASAATTVAANNPDVSITKTAPGGYVAVGDNFNFVLTVASKGTDPATNVVVTDALPAGITGVSVSPASVCGIASQVVTCNLGTMAPGTTQVITITATAGSLSGSDTGTINNVATVTAANETNTSDNRDAANVFVYQRTCGAYYANFTRYACPTGYNYIGSTANNTNPSLATCCQQAIRSDVAVVKTGPTTAQPVGGMFNFTIVVSSLGPDTANPVELTDDLLAGLTFVSASSPDVNITSACNVSLTLQEYFCNLGSMPAGTTKTINVLATATFATLFPNIVRVTTPNDINPDNDVSDANVFVYQPRCGAYFANNTRFPCPAGYTFNTGAANITNATLQTCCTRVLRPDVSVTKDGPTTPVATNTPFTYTIGVSSVGADDAVNVRMVDTLPAGVTALSVVPGAPKCTITTSAGRDTVTCNLGTMPNGTREAVTITAEATTAGVKTNTVNVTADGDVLTADNTDSTTTPIYQPTCGAFFANNTAWPCPAGSVPNNAAVNSTIVDDATCCTRIPVPNIRLTKTGPSTPQAVGSPFQFTLTVASNGQDAAPNVTVVDNLGAANMQPLAVTPEPACGITGNVVMCSFGSIPTGESRQVVITAKANGNGTLTNTATATSDGETLTGDNTDSFIVPVYQPTCGAFFANSTRFPCPEGTDFNAQEVTNANPNATVCCKEIVPARPGISLGKAGPAGQVEINKNLNFTLTVRSTGVDPAEDVVVVDALDARLTPVAVSPGTPTCSFAGQVLTCSLGTMAVNASRVITLTAKPTATGTISNVANATATNNDTKVSDTDVVNIFVFEPTCGAVNANGTKFSCPAGSVFDASKLNATSPSAANCCTALPVPDVAVTKTAPTTPQRVGDTFDFTIRVASVGDQAATNVVLNDVVPDGLVPQAVTPATGCTITGQRVACSFGTMASGASKEVKITVKSTVGNTFANVATVSADNDAYSGDNSDAANAYVYVPTCGAYTADGKRFPCPVGTVFDSSESFNTNPDEATCCNPANRVAADLALFKSAPADPVATGTTFAYTLVVENVGSAPATQTTVTDVLDAGLQVVSVTPAGCTVSGRQVSCNLGSLAAGATQTVTVNVKATTAGTYGNVATVSSPDDVNPANDEDAANAFVYAPTCASYNGVDQFPCPAGTVFNGTQATNLQPSAANCCKPNTTEAGPSIGVVKLGPPEAVAVGEQFAYRIGVASNGETAAAAVTLKDTLPASLTIVSVTPTPACTVSGQTVTCLFGAMEPSTSKLVTIQATAKTAGTILNVASVTAQDPANPSKVIEDGDAVNTFVFVSTCGAYNPNNEKYQCPQGTEFDDNALNATNPSTEVCCNPIAPPTVANVGITMAAPATAVVGQPFVYALTITASGNETSRNVTVTDVIPDGFTIGPLPAGCTRSGQRITCSLGNMEPGEVTRLNITVTPTVPGAFTNTATVGAINDISSSDNIADASTVVTAPVLVANVGISMTAPATAVVDKPFVYTLTVTASGNDTSRNVTVTDVVPDGFTIGPLPAGCTRSGQRITCSLGNMEPGAVVLRNITVTPTVPGAFTNTATVDANNDSDDSDNTASAVTNVGGLAANVGIAMTAPATAIVGQPFVYALTVTASGNDTSRNVTVTDVIPDGLTIQTVPAGCAKSGQRITCSLGNMEPGEVTQLNITVAPTVAGEFNNTASVGSSNDSIGSDNTASVPTVVTAPVVLANVGITMTAPATAVVGQPFVYALTITASGNETSRNVTVTDVIPDGFTIGPLPAGCTRSGQRITCSLGNMLSGDVKRLNITVTPTVGGEFTNTATVGSNNDSDASDNTASAPTVVTRLIGNVAVVKTGPDTPVAFGRNFDYKVMVYSVGAGAATNVVMTDTLVGNLQGVTVRPTECVLAGQKVTCNFGTMAPGASKEVTITVKAVNGFGPIGNEATVSANEDSDPSNDQSSTNVVVYVPTCASFTPEGAKYPCPAGTQFNVTAGGAANPSDEVCCSPAIAPAPDVRITLVGPPEPVSVGQPVVYNMTTSSVGSATATNVAGTVTIPDGLKIVSVNPQNPAVTCTVSGQTVSCTLGDMPVGDRELVQIITTAQEAGSLYGSGTVEATTDVLLSNNADGSLVYTFVPSCGEFKSAGGNPPKFAPYTCPVGTVNNGQEFTNTDPSTANCCAPVEPPGVSDVTITKVGPSEPVRLNTDFAYTFTVRSVGTRTATNVTVVDDMPAPLQLVSVAPATLCSTAGGKVTCSLGDMPPNTERTIVVTAQTATAGRLQNTVAVASANETKTPNNADGAYSYSYPATCGAYFWDSSRFPCAPGTVFKESAVDNESPDQTACCMAVSPPTPTPDVSLTKVAPATVAVGSTFDYTLTVAASGSTASNVVLTDPMPANVKALSASTGCTVALGGKSVTCNWASLPAGSSKVVKITAQPSRAGRLTNTAEVRAKVDSNPVNNKASAAVGFLGACCSVTKAGKAACTNTLPTSCTGTFSANASCTPNVCQAPPPPPGLGACCDLTTGTCANGKRQSECALRTNQWRANGTCGVGGFCTGACCTNATRACSQTTKAACSAAGTSFALYKSCAETCPAVCTPAWQSCTPCNGRPGCVDSCCKDTACSSAKKTYGAQPSYVCKPVNTCSPEGGLCGSCKGGGACCSGLECKWDYYSKQGRCRKPSSCTPPGGTCKSDNGECCAGSRCSYGKCKVATGCNTKCKTKACEQERIKDCQAVAAAVASNA